MLVIEDPLPLVKIFSDQALENIKNPRLLNFKERTLMYRFQIKLCLGKLNLALDWVPSHPDIRLVPHAKALPKLSPRQCTEVILSWRQLREECQTIVHVIQNGFPKSHNDLPLIVWIFWFVREELYCLKGVTVKANKILILDNFDRGTGITSCCTSRRKRHAGESKTTIVLTRTGC